MKRTRREWGSTQLPAESGQLNPPFHSTTTTAYINASIGHFERSCQRTRWDEEGVSLLQLHPLAPVGPVSQEDVALLARQDPVLVQGEVVRRWRHQPEHLKGRCESLPKTAKNNQKCIFFNLLENASIFFFIWLILLCAPWTGDTKQTSRRNRCGSLCNIPSRSWDNTWSGKTTAKSLTVSKRVADNGGGNLTQPAKQQLPAGISTTDQSEGHCARENCSQWDTSPLEINWRAIISVPRHRRLGNWARWDWLDLSESTQSMRCM